MSEQASMIGRRTGVEIRVATAGSSARGSTSAKAAPEAASTEAELSAASVDEPIVFHQMDDVNEFFNENAKEELSKDPDGAAAKDAKPINDENNENNAHNEEEKDDDDTAQSTGKVRFSLGAASTSVPLAHAQEQQGGEDTVEVKANQARSLLRKMAAATTPDSSSAPGLQALGRASLSPSELSRVSTAPPLSAKSTGSKMLTQEGEEEEQDDEDSSASPMGSPANPTPASLSLSVDTPTIMPTQEGNEDFPMDDNDDDENDANGVDSSAVASQVDDEAKGPTTDTSQDEEAVEAEIDDGDDLIPPAPPEPDEDDLLDDDSEDLEEIVAQTHKKSPRTDATTRRKSAGTPGTPYRSESSRSEEQEIRSSAKSKMRSSLRKSPGAVSSNDDDTPEAVEDAGDDDEDMVELNDTDSDDRQPAQADNDLDDDMGDDDKEGPGFDMADDRKGSSPSPRSKMRESVKRKRKLPKKALDTSIDESEVSVKPAVRKKKKKKGKVVTFSPKGIQTRPRDFRHVPVSDLRPEGDTDLRRSRRARVQPLAFWKNERQVYGPNDDTDDPDLANMPVPKSFSLAEDTPYKERKPSRTVTVSVSKKKSKKSVTVEDDEGEGESPLDLKKLPKKYKYMNGTDANLWDPVYDKGVQLKVIGFQQDLQMRKYADSKGRTAFLAAQSFNVANDDTDIYPGYIMGTLELPPGGIKQPESVGGCAQTFTVVRSQGGALEVAYGQPDEEEGALNPKTAQRFLLSQGDMFRVPPSNCYRIQNHSAYKTAQLTWTIIRPFPPPLDEELEEESVQESKSVVSKKRKSKKR